MPIHNAIDTLEADAFRDSCGSHLLDHLAADRAGLTAGQVSVVPLLQINANLP